MNKAFTQALRESHSRGVTAGAMLMSLVVLISLENTAPDHMGPESIGPLMQDMEKDIQRVYAETVASARNEKELREMTDRLVGYCEEIRKKRGMDSLEEDPGGD